MSDEYNAPPDFMAPLRGVVAEVMDVADVTIGRTPEYAVRFRGTLRIDSIEAYNRVDQVFRERNFTPLFRLEEDRHVIKAVSGVIDPKPSNPWIDRKSTRLNSSHIQKSRMPSSA